MKWIVSAKSGTSFDRAINKSKGITLYISNQQRTRRGRKGNNIRDKRIQHPTKPQSPSCRNISSYISPVKNLARSGMFARDKRGEDDEDQGDGVVEGLQEEHLGENVPGTEVGKSPRTGRATTTGHIGRRYRWTVMLML